MNKNKLLLLMGMLMVAFINMSAQQNYSSTDPRYAENVECADSAYRAGDYQLCADCYEKAFQITATSYLSMYRAARCYSLSKKPKAAHQMLEKAMAINWEEVVYRLKDDKEFDNLRKKKRCWKKVTKTIQSYEATINVALRDELLKMQEEDQKYRAEMQEVSDHYGWESTQMQELWKKQSNADSINIIRIEEIIAQYGYPGKSLVGRKAMGATFLIIQHADLPYQEKYLPLLTEAAEKGEMKKSSLALLIDRINMRNGKPQIYGSQVTTDHDTGEPYFHEIEDEANVDKRRAEMGLGPLSEYAKLFGFEYPRVIKPLTDKEIKGMLGRWNLQSIRYTATDEKIKPQGDFWLEFRKNGVATYNREANTCEMPFMMTRDRKIKFSPVSSCTEKCCDKDFSKKNIKYFNAKTLELKGDRLTLHAEGVEYQFTKKKYAKKEVQPVREKNE